MAGSAVAFHNLGLVEDSFEEAVLTGLARPLKSIPSQFLYDEQGSALFDRITTLREYYPTRTEAGILEDNARAIAELMGKNVALIELGSGSSRKIRVLLDALDSLAAYVPIDISEDHLRRAAEAFAADHPAIPVVAIAADYTRGLTLSPDLVRGTKRVAFFPGSTIGNLVPIEAIGLLEAVRRLVGRGGDMLIGVDLDKDPAVIDEAYNDRGGVTAAFSLNLLERINRELGADFDLDRFEHEAFYVPHESRVEIYLRSLARQTVRVRGRRFHFARGERLLTEYSYKYTLDGFRRLAREAGFEPVESWTDADRMFSVHYLRNG